MASKWVQIGSLWRGKKQGVLTGTLGGKYGAKMIVLPADKEGKSENFPDFTVYVVPYEPEEEGAGKGSDDVPF